MARLRIHNAGLTQFIGQVQRGQHSHAQRVHRAAMRRHRAHLGVDARGQFANVVRVLAGEMVDLIVDFNGHKISRTAVLSLSHAFTSQDE